ncbi:Host cell factor 1 [Thoreauomyces humboldtii]|nr:Host cell factor 1 [Thoreauomyces humboldtii]
MTLESSSIESSTSVPLSPASQSETPKASPGLPTAGMAIASDEHLAFIFGGVADHNEGPVFLDQLLQYDAISKSLTSIATPGSGAVGPGARVNSTLVYVPARPNVASVPYLFLFGGYDATDAYLDDSWLFNLGTRTWAPARMAGTPPAAREHHSAVYWHPPQGSVGAGARVVIYGGMCPDPQAPDVARRLQDVVFVDLENYRWVHPKCSGAAPPGRSGHSAGVYANKMVVFGGQERDRDDAARAGFSNSVWALDLESWTWQAIELSLPTGIDTPIPAGRNDSGAALVGSSLYISNGDLGVTSEDGMTLLLADDTWRLALGPPMPPGPLFVSRGKATQTSLDIRWQDDGWEVDHSYEVFIRKDSDSIDSWAKVYRGTERACSIEAYELENGDTREVRADSGYHVRVVAVNWAGRSSEWDLEAGIASQREAAATLPQHEASILPLDREFIAPDKLFQFAWESDPLARHLVELRCSVHPMELQDTSGRKRRKTLKAAESSTSTGDASTPTARPQASGDWIPVWSGTRGQWAGFVPLMHRTIARNEYVKSTTTTKGAKRERESDSSLMYVGYQLRACPISAEGIGNPVSEGPLKDYMIPLGSLELETGSSSLPPLTRAVFVEALRASAPPVELLPLPAKKIAKTKGLRPKAKSPKPKTPATTRKPRKSASLLPGGSEPATKGKRSASAAKNSTPVDVVGFSPEPPDVPVKRKPGRKKAKAQSSPPPEVRPVVASPDSVDMEPAHEKVRAKGDAAARSGVKQQIAPPASIGRPKRGREASEAVPAAKSSPKKTTKTPKAPVQRRTSAKASREPSSEPAEDAEHQTATPVASRGRGSVPTSRVTANPVSRSPSSSSSSPPLAVASPNLEPPSLAHIVSDPETGRPELGNPVNGFHYNLRFGDRIQVSSNKETGIKYLWYHARMLFYSPSVKHDAAWRIKIHWVGFGNVKFDEFVELVPQRLGHIRPENDEPGVVRGDVKDVPEEMFDARGDSKQKMWAITVAERIEAAKGNVVVRKVPAIIQRKGTATKMKK